MRFSPIVLLFLPVSLSAQVLVPDLLTTLPAQINETSGLVMIDGVVWTVLDSGNPPAVYAIDETDGTVIRTVDLLGATNVDYEEITSDASWVYIGDFGNNGGSRTNLRIYRIPRAALEDDLITEVQVDTIRFSYADQSDFTPAYNNNNFDCEAFVAVDDSLFLFTKRWVDERTRLYALPAVPGDHVAQVRATFDTDGVITAASWDGVDRLVLLGHEDDPGQPFVWLFNDVEDHDFLGGTGIRRPVDMFDHQTEGIAWYSPDEWILSNEMTAGISPALWTLEVGQVVVKEESWGGPSLFPVPAVDQVRVSGIQGTALVSIHDHAGRCVHQGSIVPGDALDVNDLCIGTYVTTVVSREGTWRLPLVILR